MNAICGPTTRASAAAKFRSGVVHEPQRYKNEYRKLEDTRSGGRLHALLGGIIEGTNPLVSIPELGIVRICAKPALGQDD
jgi:hypothetical protein